MSFVRKRTDIKQAEVDRNTVGLDESVSRPRQTSQNIVVNRPAGVPLRATRGGPEGLNWFGIILMEIPTGASMYVLSTREEGNVRVEMKSSQRRSS